MTQSIATDAMPNTQDDISDHDHRSEDGAQKVDLADSGAQTPALREQSSILSEDDYDAIAAAVMETERGRWFLDEYARRNRNSDTSSVLGAIDKLEERIDSKLAQSANVEGQSTSNALISRDVLDLAEAITQMKREVQQLSGKGESDDHFDTATVELEAIVAQTETATSEILEAAEKIQEVVWTLREEGANETQCDIIESKIIDVYTACSFQDLTGQRSNKVVRLVSYVERRVASMMEILGISEPKSAAADDGLSSDARAEPSDLAAHQEDDARPDAHLLNGPAMEGDANEQGDIDALMFESGGFDAINVDEIDAVEDIPATDQTADDVVLQVAETEVTATEAAEFDVAVAEVETVEAADIFLSDDAVPNNTTSEIDDDLVPSTVFETGTTEALNDSELNETAHDDAVPVEAVPVEAVSVETVPVEAVPVEAVPVEAVPVETASVETAPMPKASWPGVDDELETTNDASTTADADAPADTIFDDSAIAEIHDAEILDRPTDSALLESVISTYPNQDLFDIEALEFDGPMIGEGPQSEQSDDGIATPDSVGSSGVILSNGDDFAVDDGFADMFVSEPEAGLLDEDALLNISIDDEEAMGSMLVGEDVDSAGEGDSLTLEEFPETNVEVSTFDEHQELPSEDALDEAMILQEDAVGEPTAETQILAAKHESAETPESADVFAEHDDDSAIQPAAKKPGHTGLLGDYTNEERIALFS